LKTSIKASNLRNIRNVKDKLSTKVIMMSKSFHIIIAKGQILYAILEVVELCNRSKCKTITIMIKKPIIK
jgi:hypothetical protein